MQYFQSAMRTKLPLGVHIFNETAYVIHLLRQTLAFK